MTRIRQIRNKILALFSAVLDLFLDAYLCFSFTLNMKYNASGIRGL